MNNYNYKNLILAFAPTEFNYIDIEKHNSN